MIENFGDLCPDCGWGGSKGFFHDEHGEVVKLIQCRNPGCFVRFEIRPVQKRVISGRQLLGL